MGIDLNHFTPYASLFGGALIGLAAALLLLMNGRIAGISGIIGGLMVQVKGDVAWRFAFIAGIIGSPMIYSAVIQMPEATIDAGYGGLMLAGLLVGIGTRYGSGCTSGHGVCGLSRLSPRSLIATITFMAAGFFTVFLIRHVFKF